MPSYISKPRPAPLPSYPIMGHSGRPSVSSVGSPHSSVFSSPTTKPTMQQHQPSQQQPPMPPMRFRPTLQPHYSIGSGGQQTAVSSGGKALQSPTNSRDSDSSSIPGFFPITTSTRTQFTSSATRPTSWASLSGVLFYLALTLTSVLFATGPLHRIFF